MILHYYVIWEILWQTIKPVLSTYKLDKYEKFLNDSALLCDVRNIVTNDETGVNYL